MKARIWNGLVLLVLASATACGSNAPPQDDSSANTQNQGAEGRTAVSVDPSLQKLCGLPTPTFSFDRAGVEDSAPLQALAECLSTGPGKDVNLRLIGHADPRGELDYNFALGQRRAGTIAEFLSKKGVKEQRLATSSRGETEATGADESGWAHDRRVEILIKN